MDSGGRADALGYNTEEVEAIGEGINKYANQTGEVIVTAIKTNIVDKVAEEWVSEAAVEYFDQFKDELKQKEASITEVFQNFSDQIGKAGQNWADQTKGTAPTMPAVDTVTLDLDVSSMKATDGNGDRYMYEDIEEKVKGYVENARTEILSAFANMESEINAETAFFGGGQSEAVQEAASSLGDQVNTMLDEVISSDSGSLITAIQNYKSEYSDTATSNASSFEDSAFTE
ncbi:MAG TPA: hypothetical protein OIM49_03620 [Clostridiaceae bacterium]|jgi:hypothetical protein|nr:hypothetical protein [Clostridiaceae bacterium]